MERHKSDGIIASRFVRRRHQRGVGQKIFESIKIFSITDEGVEVFLTLGSGWSAIIDEASKIEIINDFGDNLRRIGGAVDSLEEILQTQETIFGLTGENRVRSQIS